MKYKTSQSIDDALQGMATQYPDTCAKFYLDEPSWAAKNIPAVRIQEGVDSLTPVLFTGGVHGRELVPPDALLSFCENLLDADSTGTDIIYNRFTDASGTNYDDYIVDNATVRRILNTFSLFVVPCVNPDGRDFALSAPDKINKMWRKNRRPDPTCVGVDINRNFPFVWDVDTYYQPSVIQDIHVSKVPCDAKFRGYTQSPPPDSGPEPETQNLINLVAQQSIQYLVDVHMFGRTVLYPWGMDTDQIADTTQTFSNATWDGKRDGPGQSVYGEYVPATLLTTLVQLADAMVTEIKRSAGADTTAIRRSTYTAKQSALAGATTGAFDDYTFGQQFLNPQSDTPSTFAFTLECGYEKLGDNDGGFAPHPVTQYPKVEREVHAALFGLLNAI